MKIKIGFKKKSYDEKYGYWYAKKFLRIGYFYIDLFDNK